MLPEFPASARSTLPFPIQGDPMTDKIRAAKKPLIAAALITAGATAAFFARRAMRSRQDPALA